MSSYTEKIMNLIKQKPGIRQVEIADMADCDPDHVDHAIADFIANGTVIKNDTLAPNGKLQPCYSIKLQATPKEKSKVDLAIEFMQANGGQATEKQLQTAMSIPAGYYANQYLASAIKTNKMHRRSNGLFVIGMAPEDLEPEAPLIRRKPANAGPEQKSTEAVQLVATPQKITSYTPRTVPDQAGIICALWSDGCVEIRRSDQQPIILTAKEAATLIDYLGKINTQQTSVALGKQP